MKETHKKYPKPDKPGFYWAKSDEKFGWYNLIVHIHGEIPYLQYEAWDRGLHACVLTGTDPDFPFGPEILYPKE